MRMLVGLGLLGGLLGGLVANAPAAKLLPRLLGPESGVRAYELSGRLLDGRIGYLDLGGVQLEDVDWRLRPGALLGGAVAADLSLRGPGLRANGSLRHGLIGGKTTIRELQASAGLKQIQPMLKIPFLPLDGQLSAQIDELRLEGPTPIYAQGLLRLGNTEWALIRPPAALGDFAADISTADDGQIVAALRDEQAELSLRGELRLQADGRYALDARLKPTAQTPAPVANNLRALGRTDREGWHTLKYQGQLPR